MLPSAQADPLRNGTVAHRTTSESENRLRASQRDMAATNPALSTRQLGNSDLHLTRIGFGAWAIGGGNWEFAWGAQNDSESIKTIERALDLGINWIDTAAIYGLGHSEEVVARALKHAPSKPYIFTKCSMRWTEDRKIYRSLNAGSIQEEIEASLARLRVDAIDLYQIHWPDPEVDIEEGWEMLARLQQQGKVRYIGVSNFNVEQIKRAQKIAPVTSLQPPYSLLNRKVEAEILPYCQEQNIGVINYSPMSSGLLTGKMTAERILAMPADDWRQLQRAEALRQPEISGAPARNRKRLGSGARSRGNCLDPRKSRHHSRNCRRTRSGSGGGNYCGGQLPSQS
jgi:aryl-alcohol dehydrogenase-like predicted oxidoreductase